MVDFFASLPDITKIFLANKARGKSVFLPEGNEIRVQQAAQILQAEFAVRVQMGSVERAIKNAPQTLELVTKNASARGKKVSEILKSYAEDVFFDAGRALAQGEVDAVVGGANVPTAHVIRAALATVGLAPSAQAITSGFLMNLKNPTAGNQKLLLFADGAIIPRPTSAQLAEIAFFAAHALQLWTGAVPKVAFLSFSTAGSADHEEVHKVRSAFEIFSARHPTVIAEGEIQFDAATVPEIALQKNKNSTLKGEANVMIFPDLNAGNIGYKMTQRLAGADAWGPVLFGSAKPFSDLSRGVTYADIVHSVILTLALC